MPKSLFNCQRHFFDCPPDCPKRKPACHSHCDTYLKKRAELDELNATEKKRKAIDRYTIEQVVKYRNEKAIKDRNVPKKRYHP